MKNLIASSFLFAALTSLSAATAHAQLELPQPSPAAKVSQRVGLTDIEVEYSSPAVNGRKVWGELVPYGKPWRTGANAATKITFSRDVKVGGKAVPAGSYSIVTVPEAKGFTVALSKDTTWFAGGKEYSPKADLLRTAATTTEIPHRERLTFLFSNTPDQGTTLDLEWEKLRVSLPIAVDTAAQVQASIKGTLDNGWRAHASAARFTANNPKVTPAELTQALAWADTSIGIQSTWYNNWVRAEILAKQGNVAEARKAAQTAWDLGQKDKNFFYKDAVQKALADWKVDDAAPAKQKS